jgi:hypothetical protein
VSRENIGGFPPERIGGFLSIVAGRTGKINRKGSLSGLFGINCAADFSVNFCVK